MNDPQPDTDAAIRATAARKRVGLDAVARLLSRSGIDPDELGRVERVRLSDYQVAVRGDDGEATVLDLEAASLVLSPAWTTGPEWAPLDRPALARPRFSGTVRRVDPPADGLSRVLILPDPQIGFRLAETAPGRFELDPFHDPAALGVAITLARVARPDRIVCLGDLLDLPAFGKYRQEPGFAQAGNAALEVAHGWLAALAELAPDVVVLEGNHDARLATYALDNARAAYGLRRAGDPPASWPVLTVPHLLRLDELGVDYRPGYPANAVELAPNLVAVHGSRLKLRDLLGDESVSAVQGHVHRMGVEWRTVRSPSGTRRRFAATPGCLCRVDGAVPGVRTGLDPRHGLHVHRPQDWQQGAAIVTVDPTGEREPVLELVSIVDGVAVWRDRHLTGSPVTLEGIS
jgi:hypothetical protein